MKRVGITTNFDKNIVPTVRLDAGYFEAIRARGALPLLIYNSKDSLSAKEIIDDLDGLILSGGIDVSPFLYGRDPNYEASFSDKRDAFETELFFEAKKKGIPILGICRGLQLVNVIMGGSLYMDLVKEGFEDIIHVKKEIAQDDFEELFHYIDIDKDSRLYSILGKDRIRVNSIHHQAICELASGLRAVAKSQDGIIEAVEMEGYEGFLALQFHPERDLDNPDFRKLFESFVEMM